MVSRRRILSRSRDDLHLEPTRIPEEEDIWHQKDKLFKVSRSPNASNWGKMRREESESRRSVIDLCGVDCLPDIQKLLKQIRMGKSSSSVSILRRDLARTALKLSAARGCFAHFASFCFNELHCRKLLPMLWTVGCRDGSASPSPQCHIDEECLTLRSLLRGPRS